MDYIEKVYYAPEWEKQVSVWLSFPHNNSEWEKTSFQNPLEKICSFYRTWIEMILDYQKVDLIFKDQGHHDQEKDWLLSLASKKFKIQAHIIANNDIWIRDYGPFFVKDETNVQPVLLEFGFNAWGEKFPPWDLDDEVPYGIAQKLQLTILTYNFILEGGALEFNGEGVLMTTKQCLLNENRNPDFDQEELEDSLKEAFSIKKIIWLERGLEGDHTDGHIDDFARFISANKILLCQTQDPTNPNYAHLKSSKEFLENEGFELDFLPLPQDMHRDGEYLPASYANFIFINAAVIMPTFNCPQDAEAKLVFERNFPDREVLTIDSSFLIQEGGGLHCASKQQSF